MDDEKLKNLIGKNIAMHRKRCGLTQLGLAEKLNYSDKAVSKWERGESAPDVQTLVQLAELFDITVNELLEDPNALPENPGKMERMLSGAVERTLKRKADKRIIVQLCSILVWFVAIFAFVVWSSFDLEKSFLPFFYAFPANCVVLLVLRSAWRDFRSNQWLITGIMWGFLVSVCLTIWMVAQVHLWKLFLLGVPGQLAILLWFRMLRKPAGETQNG